MLSAMDAEERRALARKRTVEVMRLIREEIDSNPDINRIEAARAAGIPKSTFYRWLSAPPEKIDTASIAAVADWLHDAHGFRDFAALWRHVSRSISE